jgi:hypothetical protein
LVAIRFSLGQHWEHSGFGIVNWAAGKTYLKTSVLALGAFKSIGIPNSRVIRTF